MDVRKNKELLEFDSVDSQKEWDIKRIIFGVSLFSLLVIFGIYFLLKPFSNEDIKNPNVSVLGTTESSEKTPDDISLPTQKDTDKLLKDVQDTVSKITTDNFTSSQAAIQTVIQNLQELSGGKKSATDFICEFVCKK